MTDQQTNPKSFALRPFVKSDWYGWAGAENGPNGEEPHIASNECYQIVASRHGIDIVITEFDKDGNVVAFNNYMSTGEHEDNYYVNVALAAGIVARYPTLNESQVKDELGFAFSHRDDVTL